MRKREKTKIELIKELEELRKRVAETEQPAKKPHDQFCPTCEAFLSSVGVIFELKDFKDQALAMFRSCNRLIGAASGFVGLLNDEGTRYEALFLETGELVRTVDPSFPMPFRLPRGAVTGNVIYENEFPSSSWQSALPEGHMKLDNVLLAPLNIRGKTLGLLGLANKPGPFTENDAGIASAFSNLLAVALCKSRSLESLRNSEERFRSVAESASDAIICFDNHGKIVFWNPAAETVFGYSSSEMLGKRLTSIVPKRYRSAHTRRMKQLFRKGEPNLVGKAFEMLGLKKDGSEFPAEVSFAAWQAQGKLFFTNIVRDVTGRKEAEEALKHSEGKYRTIFENTGTAIAIIDEDTSISMVNAEFEKLHGYSKEEIEGKSWTEFIVEEDLEKMKECHFLRRVKPDAAPRNYEFRLKDKSGNTRKAFLTIAMIPGTKKSVASLIDLTLVAATEETLRKQQQLLQTILDVTPDLLVLKNRELVYQAANPAFCRFVGKPLAEITGKTAYDFFPPAEAERYRKDDAEVMKLRNTQVAEEEVTGAGGKKWFYVAKTPVIDQAGSPAGVLCSMRDITELKRAEEALREKEHFLASVFSSIQDGICVLDNDLSVVKVNATLERWYADALPLVGKKCYEALYGRTQACKNCPTVRSTKTGKPVYKVVQKLGPRGEALGWFDLYCFPFVDQVTGQTKGVIEYIHDATRRKRAQEQLRQSFTKLQSTIEATIQAMAGVVEMRDAYTARHQQQVAKLACAIAEELGFPKQKVKGIRMAAIVHDIGKISTPVEILNKPTRLTELEFSLIKNHPQIGSDILRAIEFPWPIAEIVLQHHERINNSGYPFGLGGESIVPEARVLAVADVVEAMASHRPYRPALGINKALDEISQQKGILYDADAVEACLKLFMEKGFSLE